MSDGGPEHVLARARAARSNPSLATRPAFVKWLDCEIAGYGANADARSLHELLGVPADDPLVLRVASYRVQFGIGFNGLEGGQRIAHFFVEPVADLARIAERAASSPGILTIDFDAGSAAADYPSSADFPSSVFARVVQGFVALLDELGV